MSSRWGFIALITAALAYAPESRAGDEGRGKDEHDQCREEDHRAGGNPSDHGDWPRILRADADSTNLFIHGAAFGSRNGTVTLAGQRLSIASWSPTDIVAVLPKNPLPASYLLTVTPQRGRCVKASFDVALGAGTGGLRGQPVPQGRQVGPPGPAGPAGLTGPAGPAGLTGPAGAIGS